MGWVRTKTEGEATTLLESQETWVLLCFVVVVWILPKVQLYITVSEFRLYAVVVGGGGWRGRAQEEDCADRVDQVQYGQAIAAGAPPPEITYFVLASA